MTPVNLASIAHRADLREYARSHVTVTLTRREVVALLDSRPASSDRVEHVAASRKLRTALSEQPPTNPPSEDCICPTENVHYTDCPIHGTQARESAHE